VKFLRRTAQLLFLVNDTPERTALAFSLGILIGFSPLLGLHTLIGLAVSLLLRLSKVAMLIGVYLNSPWFVLPYYAFATWFGVKLLGLPEGVSFTGLGVRDIFSRAFWHWVAEQWELLIPVVVGSTILCIAFSLISYPVALHVIRRYHRNWSPDNDG
jgi:uncharacterized protein